MKILDLKLQAFGPFLKEQHIPFTSLNDKGMFLINGLTGIGKTSIFDAIVYALYGKASGEDRKDEKSLRSDYAKDEDITYVDLLFEANGKEYRIVRKAPYKRKALKGNGLVDVPSSVELTLPDKTVLSKSKEVEDKLVNDILFINRDQFKNIALLAQGEFTKLITASTKDRAEILEHIFSKEIYEEFQNKIVDKSKEMYKIISDFVSSLRTLLKQIEDGEYITGFNEAYEEVNNIPAFLDNFKALIDNLSAELKERLVATSKLKEEYETLKANLNTLKQNNKSIADYLKAVEELEHLYAKKEAYNALSVQIDNSLEYMKLIPLVRQLDALNKQLDKDAEALDKLNADLEQLKNEAKWLIEHLEEYNSNKEEVNKLNILLNSLNSINSQRQSLIKEKAEIERLDKEFAEEYKAFKDEEINYLHVRDRFFASTSYNLAKDLKDGEPCPVCGSIHHPSLAKSTDPVSEVVFNTTEKAYKTHSERIEAKRTSIASRRSGLTSQEKTMVALLKESGFESANVDLIYSHEINNLIKAKSDEKDRLNERIKDYESRKKNYDANVIDINNKIQSKKDAIKLGKSNIELINDDINKVFNENTVIKSIEIYREFKMEIDVNKAKQQLDGYNHDVLVNETIVKNTSKELIEAGRIDESELVEKVSAAQKEYEDTNSEDNLLNNRINNYIKNFKAIKKTYDECAVALQKYASINEIARVAKGENRMKLSFKMYVLADYFEKIINQANRRLNKITNGRYKLYRRSNLGVGNAANGLDLDVYDVETGKYRQASTLSGGEKFVSALSLALGLSDIIETSHALVQVESIFIDEGFGTLDDNYIDMAMKALETLKDDNKTVAIISHVEKLKEYIPDGIEVCKDDVGSKIIVKTAL